MERPRSAASRATRRALVLAAGTAAVLALVLEEIPAGGWALLGGFATAFLARLSRPLFRDAGGAALTTPGLANTLTLARFVWTAPVAALLAGGALRPALSLYVLLVLTDILDGIAARKRHEISAFGVIMDPVADVLSTFAVFTVFLIDNLVPLWLYLLLAARYVMLFAGSAVLTLRYGPIPYRATIPGKVVGVVQALGAVLIMRGTLTGGLAPGLAGVVFAALGLGFASMVVSQGFIGWRHIRTAATGRTTERGSSR